MSWDKYFLDLCDVVATNSKCMSRKIGAVVATKDHSIVSTGYNGPPRGVQHCDKRFHPADYMHKGGCPRRKMGFASGEGIDYCPAAHAEANAVFVAAREGWSLKGCTLYLNTGVPCMECLKAIIQVGIDEVVCTNKGNFYDRMSGYLIQHSGLKVREYET